MSQVGNLPFLRITLPFAIGIASYDLLDYRQMPWYAIVAGLACFIVFSMFVTRIFPLPEWRFRWITGLLILIILGLAGYLRYSLFDSTMEADSGLIASVKDKKVASVCVVQQSPVKKTNSFAALINVIAFEDSGNIHPVSTTPVMAYFSKNSIVECLLPGDTISIYASINRISGSGNPSAFDYGRFMRRKGVVLSVYLDSLSWVKISDGKPGLISSWVISIRKSIYHSINTSNLQELNKGLALALMIGVKEDLDQEVNRSFATAGAIHVLCVSGLHVGIIYMLVTYLFGYLQRIRKWGRPLFIIIGLVAIWSYALVTGLPPSVNRASVMFSFMLAGRLLQRKNNSINSVLASAFILLINEPPLIFNIGFQLSYLAVTGIITMFPALSVFWVPKNRIAVKVRDLVVVSICAQLFTFPVAVSVFNVFPNYFILTNLLVIPITGIIIYSGVLFLSLPLINLHHWVELLFDSLLSLMRWLVGLVDSMPGSSSDGIFLSSAQVWLILFAIFAALFWLRSEGNKFLIVCLISLAAFSILRIDHSRLISNQSGIIIYNVKKASVTDLISSGAMTTVVNHDTVAEKDLDFAAKAFRIKSGVYKRADENGTAVAHPKKITIAKHPLGDILFVNVLPKHSDSILNCRIAIPGSGLYPDKRVFQQVSAGKWVIDGSINRFRALQWQELAEECGVEMWNTTTQGALFITASR